MFETESQNYYEILDVKPDATQNNIRQAYFRLKSAYSRDSAALYSLFDTQETKHVLERVEQAYIVLSNPEKRKEYDQVHGFLKTPVLPKPEKKKNKNVFSFIQSEHEAASSAGTRAAHDAANAVLGNQSESVFEDPSAKNTAPPVEAKSEPTPEPKEAIEPTKPQADPHKNVRIEDYTAPRVLDGHEPSSVQDDYSSKPQENRLGILRRTDIAKNYQKDPSIEESIERETEFRGPFLRKIREYKSVTLEEMSDFTKISKTYLNCIEAEEFESLPAPVYVRSFVIQVAKSLKLPHDKVAKAYMENYKKAVVK